MLIAIFHRAKNAARRRKFSSDRTTLKLFSRNKKKWRVSRTGLSPSIFNHLEIFQEKSYVKLTLFWSLISMLKETTFFTAWEKIISNSLVDLNSYGHFNVTVKINQAVLKHFDLHQTPVDPGILSFRFISNNSKFFFTNKSMYCISLMEFVV